MVEGARLEIVLPSTGYQGSNPCLSANKRTPNASALGVLLLAEPLHHLNPRMSGTACRDCLLCAGLQNALRHPLAQTWVRKSLSLRQKKAHICLPRQCVLFSTKFALAGNVKILWRVRQRRYAVKYLLRKCEIFADANVGKFHFTSTKAEGDGRYFTIHEVNYFTFGWCRIFH